MVKEVVVSKEAVVEKARMAKIYSVCVSLFESESEKTQKTMS